jgi:multiple sugar transport system substrate-binding protein
MLKGKKKFGILMLAILLLVLTACGSGSKSSSSGDSSPAPAATGSTSPSAAPSGGSSPSSQQNIELRISWWGNADRAKLYDAILDMYEQQNPHIKTVREWTTFGDYWPKLNTQLAGGNAPDIFGLHVLLYGGEYGSKDVLEPLQPYVDRGLINLDGWDEAVINAGKLNGVFYALPKGVTSIALIFNQTMIKNAGFDLPEVTTLSEFGKYLQELRAKLPKDVYPIIDASYDSDHFIESFVRTKGKSFLTSDGKSLGFDKEDLVEFWTIWEDFRKQGLATPMQLTIEHYGQPQENSLFVKERVAIDIKPSNHGKIYSRSLTDREIAMLRTPSADNAKFRSGENLQAPSFVINKNSKYKDEAAKLINWFVNDVEAQKIYALENGIPGSSKIREALKPDLHPMDIQAIEHMETISPDLPPTDYRPQGAAEVFTLYRKYLEQLAFGRMTVQQAVDGFFQEAATVLGS